MGVTIDELEIEVGVTSRSAEEGLRRLSAALSSMRTSLDGLENGKLENFSNGIRNFASAMNSLRGVRANDFNKVAKGIQKITDLKPENIQNIANGIVPLSTALQGLASVNVDNRNVNNIINSINRLSNSNFSNVEGIRTLTNELSVFATTMSQISGIEGRTVSLVNAISRIANSGEKAQIASTALPRLGQALRTTIDNLATASTASTSTLQLTSAISKLANAGNKVIVSANNLDYLSQKVLDFMKAMQNAPQLSANTVQMLNAIGNIANAGRSANSAFNNIANYSSNNAFNGVRRLGSAFKNLVPSINKANNSSKGFVSTIGMFYAKFFLLIRAVKLFGKAITGASDYIEAYNYFDVALTKIGKENQSNYKNMGYENAKTYADSYKERLTSLTSKMTGFDISKDGDIQVNGGKSLGLDITELTQFEARISQMTNSVGMLGEGSVATSKALAMLSGDLSSLTNIDLDQVQENLTSGLSGMTAAVRKYGLDISNATLKQYAFELGITKSVTSMSQAEKQYLRMIAILDQSKVSWGDLANTINSPANQFRMLKTNIKQAGMMLGNLFTPIIQKILPWLNAMTLAIKDLIQWIGNLFGLKFSNISTAIGADDTGITDVADDVDSVADSIDDATDSAKKLNKQLQGFDELNNLTTSKTSGSDSGSGGSGGGSDVSGVLNDALIKAVEDYEKRWNKAFSNMTSDAENLKNKIEEVFKADWKTGDFTDVGELLGSKTKEGLDSIPWDDIQKNIDKASSSLATLLNGFFETDGLGAGFGKSIAEAINTQVSGVYTFAKTFNWDGFGKFIKEGVDTFLDTWDSEKQGKSVGALGSGIATAVYNVVSDTKTWKKLGTKLGNGIKGFFEELEEVNPKTGLSGWQTLGKDIGNSIQGIAEAISKALDTVSWTQVGKDIAEAISNIDIPKSAWKLTKLVGKLVEALGKAIVSFVETDPLDSAIVLMLGGLALSGAPAALGAALTRVFNAYKIELGRCVIGLGLALATFKFMDSDSVIQNIIGAPLTAFLAAFAFTSSLSVALFIAGAVFAWEAGFNIGKRIAAWLMGGDENGNIEVDGVEINLVNWHFTDYSPLEWAEALYEWDKDMKEATVQVGIDAAKGLWEGMKKGVSEGIEACKLLVDTIVGKVKELLGIHSPSTVFAEIGGYIVEGLKNGISNAISDIKEWLNTNVVNKITSAFNDIKEFSVSISTKFSETKESIKEKWNELASNVKDKTANFKADVATKWKDISDKWGNLTTHVKDIKASFSAKVSTSWSDIKAKWNELTKNVKDKTANFKANFKTIAASSAKKWLKPVVTAFNNLISMLNDFFHIKWKAVKVDIGGKKFTIVPEVEKQLFTIKKITGFESGGFPKKADLFFANENGKPEMVGRMGNRTAVANNDQITKGISDAVFNALAPVLTSVATELSNMNNKGTALYVEGVSEGDIVKITKNANDSHKKRFGTPLYT